MPGMAETLRMALATLMSVGNNRGGQSVTRDRVKNVW